MPKKQKYFDTKFFRFLRELAVNNDRTWFKSNKSRYEEEVRAPFLRFIQDFGPDLEKISPHLVADPRPTGGSFFRIYRDTRFSKDKTPYKTHAAAHFRHSRAKDVHAPGVYLHVEPGNCFAGLGIWRPEADALRQIRTAIAENPSRWKRIRGRKPFDTDWKLGGDALKRPPRGFDPEHALIDEIKRKDFIAITNFKQSEVSSPSFAALFAKRCRAAKPLGAFLCDAIGLKW